MPRFRLKTIAFQAVLVFVGIIIGLSSYPRLVAYVPPKRVMFSNDATMGRHGGSIFRVTTDVPERLTVTQSDAAHILITNIDYPGSTAELGSVTIRAVATGGCTLDHRAMLTQPYPELNESNGFTWHVVAVTPGQCNIAFRVEMPGAAQNLLSTDAPIAILDRLTIPQIIIIYSLFMGAAIPTLGIAGAWLRYRNDVRAAEGVQRTLAPARTTHHDEA